MAHDPGFGCEFLRRTAKALASRLSATRLQLLDVFRDQAPSQEFTHDYAPAAHRLLCPDR